MTDIDAFPEWMRQPDDTHYVLDVATREVRRASPAEWAIQQQDKTLRRVQSTDIPDVGVVSTVFLGLDHSFGRGPRQLFETAYDIGEGWDVVARYANYTEAEDGHNCIVAALLDWGKDAQDTARDVVARAMMLHRLNHDSE